MAQGLGTPAVKEERTNAVLKLPLPGRWVVDSCNVLSISIAFNSKWEYKSLSFFLFFCHRFRILWDEEVERMGPEKASLGRVVWKFQRTRVLMDIVVNILCIIMAAIGPVSAVALLWPRLPGPRLAKNVISYFLYELVGLVHCWTPWGRIFIKLILVKQGSYH